MAALPYTISAPVDHQSGRGGLLSQTILLAHHCAKFANSPSVFPEIDDVPTCTQLLHLYSWSEVCPCRIDPGCHNCSYSIHQMIQLRQLSLGERSPGLGGTCDIAETKEQVSDFIQRKSELTRTLNDCQAVEHRGIVTSLSAYPLWGRKQANVLVKPNRRGPKSNVPCDLRNGELSHTSF